MHTGEGRLIGSDPLRLFGQRRVPGGGHGERYGEFGVEAMNYVEAKENRYMQALLGHRDLLQSINFLEVGEEQK